IGENPTSVIIGLPTNGSFVGTQECSLMLELMPSFWMRPTILFMAKPFKLCAGRSRMFGPKEERHLKSLLLLLFGRPFKQCKSYMTISIRLITTENCGLCGKKNR